MVNTWQVLGRAKSETRKEMNGGQGLSSYASLQIEALLHFTGCEHVSRNPSPTGVPGKSLPKEREGSGSRRDAFRTCTSRALRTKG